MTQGSDIGLPVIFTSFRVSGFERKAQAEVSVCEEHKFSFGTHKHSNPNWVASRGPIPFSVEYDATTVVTVTALRSDGIKVHKTASSKPTPFWEFISRNEHHIPLSTPNDEIMGIAHLKFVLDDSMWTKPVYDKSRLGQKVSPTLDTLYDIIIRLEACKYLDQCSSRRPYALTRTILSLLWEQLNLNWAELVADASRCNFNANDLRANACEDALTIMSEQAGFLANLVPAMRTQPARDCGADAVYMLLAIAETAALIHRYSKRYTTLRYSSPGTQQTPVSKAFLRMRLQHIVLRDRILGIYHRKSRVAFTEPEPFIAYLLKSALQEYEKRGSWHWASYASVFGILRMEEATAAFKFILQTLAEHSQPEGYIMRDYLRRLLAHTMISSRLTPEQLELDVSRLTFRHATRPLATNEPAQHVDHGSYGVVYYATYQNPGTSAGEEVASKSLKLSGMRTERSLYPEIINCFTFDHPNVIKLKGIGHRGDGSLQLVFPWMQHGQVGNYARDRIESGAPHLEQFVRRLIFQVASGLAYIHQEGIAHGDLRTSNILVDVQGNAVICDFGLSVYANGHSKNYKSTRQGNDHWLAPELQVGGPRREPGRPTCEGDIFSFALAWVEIYSGIDHPWANTVLPKDYTPREAILRNIRPNRPLRRELHATVQMGQRLWDLLQRCWDHEPSSRPSAQAIVRSLQA